MQLYEDFLILPDIKCVSEKHEGLENGNTRLTHMKKLAEGIEHTAIVYTKINS